MLNCWNFKQIFAHFLFAIVFIVFVALAAWHSFQSHPFIYNVNEEKSRKQKQEQSVKNPWQAEPLLLSEKPCMNSPQAMKFACNFQYRENREKSAGRNVVPISLTKGAGKRRLLVNDWPCQKTLNNPNNGSRHSQFLKSHAHLLFPSNRVISVAN